ncbi:MAG: hypothetical protein EXQ94_03255, partial [Alphaproteobacteria bacterium]|nr:hypothetical protein [Alphaproteobacteria bacterium]
MSFINRAAGNLRMRSKLAILLVSFGIVPAVAMLGVFLFQNAELKRAQREPLAVTATSLGDTIDRNLFERYGDVQAFSLNGLAHDPTNWRRPGADNPLVRAIDGYMVNYGLYRVMLLADMDGNILAVNSVSPVGEALATEALYGINVADATWFQDARAGKFLEGSNGLTGTVVERPARNGLIADVYGDDGYVITFAAPVRNSAGEAIGVWANFADFGLVEEIVGGFYADLAAKGEANAEITVLDAEGVILVDYDSETMAGGAYERDWSVVESLNLVEQGVEAAVAATRGETGSMDTFHSRKMQERAAGYAHSDGAYTYPGLGWSVLIRVPIEDVYATVDNVKHIMLIAIA